MEQIPPAPGRNESRLVLFVHGSAALLRQATDVITDAGYEIITSTTRHAAASAIDRRVPDLVITALWISRQEDGLELLAELRMDARTQDVPVVIICETQEEYDRLQDSLGGILCAVVKSPFDWETMLNEISTCFDEPPEPVSA